MSAIERTLTGLLAASAMAGKGGVSMARQAARQVRRARQGTGRLRSHPPITFTRTSAVQTIGLVAGEASGSATPALSQVQTSDLIGMYDEYKINWVKFRLIPRYDSGQSGVTNNTNVWVAAASDVTGQVTAPTFVQVTAFDNHKVGSLVSGTEYTYTFSPKAVNALAAGNLAVNRNDWIVLSAAGVAVAHQNLIYNIKSLNAGNILNFDFIFEVNFSVKQAS
jgi:hypothetical protein